MAVHGCPEEQRKAWWCCRVSGVGVCPNAVAPLDKALSAEGLRGSSFPSRLMPFPTLIPGVYMSYTDFGVRKRSSARAQKHILLPALHIL